MSSPSPSGRPASSLLANLLLMGVIVTLGVLNIRPVYTGRVVEQARWQHGWPLPCLWRARAVERLERRFGWLSSTWPRPGAPSGSYAVHRGAFAVDAAIALVLVGATAWASSRLLRGRGNPRQLGPQSLLWLVAIVAAVAILVEVDDPTLELALTGFVCLGTACTLHAAVCLLFGLLPAAR